MDIQLALLAGAFVDAVYDAYEAEEGNPYPKIVMPVAPSAFDLVAYISMEDFVFRAGNPANRRFYGLLAHESETNHYVLAIRGTEGPLEWWDDAHVLLVPFREANNCGSAAQGFITIYSTLDIEYTDKAEYERHGLISATFAQKVRNIIRVHEAGRKARRTGLSSRAVDMSLAEISLTVTGHSLGSALATLFVMQNDTEDPGSLKPQAIYTFASPRVGDATFAARFNALPMQKWRIYNIPDLVPQMPLSAEGFVHVDAAYRVDSRSNPDITWTLSCFHNMATYLAMLGKPMPVHAGCHVRQLPPGEASVVNAIRNAERRILGIKTDTITMFGEPPTASAAKTPQTSSE